MKRIIQINDTDEKYCLFIQKKYNFEFKDRKIKLKFKQCKHFKIQLFNYNNQLSFCSTSRHRIVNILRIIDEMPVRREEINRKRKNGIYTSDYSGLHTPEQRCFQHNSSIHISHCFKDFTHHTCCLLGPEARDYSNNSGNPIGDISKKISKNKTKLLYPWCTCSGSQVCSFYGKTFNDGTRILFMYNPRNKAIYYNVPLSKERTIIEKFGIGFHRTPGVF